MISTTLCYIEKNNSYLMLHRTKKQKDVNKDKWIGIGGKFENCESPFDCVIREVKEETGFVLNKPEYRGLVTFVSRTSDGAEPYYELMHLFWCGDFSVPEGRTAEDLPQCDEGELAWVPKGKMKDLPQWESDVLFLDLIEKHAPFFSMKVEYFDGKLVNVVQEQ
ncbi:MAG: 8-oxo-dGTP diphosphatase [Treponema sp.]|nr:8-oxo-dGTP diphosphatase [Treponema sp.]